MSSLEFNTLSCYFSRASYSTTLTQQIQRREPIDLNIFEDLLQLHSYLGSKETTSPVEPFYLLAASDLSLFVADFASSLLCFFIKKSIEIV